MEELKLPSAASTDPVARPLALKLRDVQHYTRRAKPCLLTLLQPWDAFAVITNNACSKHVYFVDVQVPSGAFVVVSTDIGRTHGRKYRVRVSEAIVKRVRHVHATSDMEDVTELPFVPSCSSVQQPTPLKHGDRIEYGDDFEPEPFKIFGRGLYVSPTFSEAMKLLTYIMRYYVEDSAAAAIAANNASNSK